MLGVMKMIDDLSMAHDNLQRELSDIKRLMGKDKHELIKANIALNKQVQELERERDEWRDTSQSYYMTNQELRGQNKRYRELLEKIKEMTRYDDCREAEIYELVSDELEGEER